MGSGSAHDARLVIIIHTYLFLIAINYTILNRLIRHSAAAIF
jgi:hypothetical protein